MKTPSSSSRSTPPQASPTPRDPVRMLVDPRGLRAGAGSSRLVIGGSRFLILSRVPQGRP